MGRFPCHNDSQEVETPRGFNKGRYIKCKFEAKVRVANFVLGLQHETKLKMLLSQLGMKNVKGNFNQSAWKMGIHN